MSFREHHSTVEDMFQAFELAIKWLKLNWVTVCVLATVESVSLILVLARRLLYWNQINLSRASCTLTLAPQHLHPLHSAVALNRVTDVRSTKYSLMTDKQRWLSWNRVTTPFVCWQNKRGKWCAVCVHTLHWNHHYAIINLPVEKESNTEMALSNKLVSCTEWGP